ncbi:hypothetical protein [Rhizobium rhizogenes]|uniref:hypothetical protein n=1 Tax=Rhizobium rhizogenes TaxID=359 RepID=UPI00157174FC|nr:hypothetical protein [Rhizobium rhizogenes]NTF69409.1 hypothetical protein [Rhizobium rhizogenes]
MSTVPARDFHKVVNVPAMKIFAVIADLYGRKMADDIAREAIKPGYPAVIWPQY